MLYLLCLIENERQKVVFQRCLIPPDIDIQQSPGEDFL
jgi:hypothetical protein